MSDAKEELTAIRARKAVIASELSELTRREAESLRQIAYEDYGVRVGSIVLHKGKPHRVSRVDTFWSWSGKPWIEGNPPKKDGTFSTAKRNLFGEWTLLDTPES